MANSKVIWSEGMFLRPQHFQQQDRYVESLVEARSSALGAYAWGLQEFSFDQELLDLGKLSIIRMRGVFPDGTPFAIPDEDALPKVLDLPLNTADERIYLCIPLRRPGARDIDEQNPDSELTRYRKSATPVRNSTSQSGEEMEIDTGQLNISLKPASDDLSGYAAIPIAQVLERRQDKPLKLANQFIPPMLDCAAHPELREMLKELQGLVEQRGAALGGRLADSGRAGSAEIADYMLLQVINRIQPLCLHLGQVRGLHPLAFYTELIQMTGELATFTTQDKRAPQFPPYLHDDLATTFFGTFNILRRCLSTVLETTAVSLELTERKYGIHVAPISDRSLVGSANFVLAVKADLPSEQLRNNFGTQAKIAPVEKVRDIISAQLPGIPIKPLPVAPRQIPYHAGFSYFELGQTGELWKAMQSSGGFAIHIGANFPGLTMELWAIRNQ